MTGHQKIRRHSKVSALPQEVREAVHRAILAGRTYEEIVEHLRGLADQGEIAPEEVPSRSGLGRYGKEFLARMERLRIVQEQARAIVEEAAGSGLVLEEAATSLALNEIMTLMMIPKGGETLTPHVVAQIATAIARLQSSSATRERARIEVRKEMQKQVKGKLNALAHQAQREGAHLDAETLRRVREEIYGIIETE